MNARMVDTITADANCDYYNRLQQALTTIQQHFGGDVCSLSLDAAADSYYCLSSAERFT